MNPIHFHLLGPGAIGLLASSFLSTTRAALPPPTILFRSQAALDRFVADASSSFPLPTITVQTNGSPRFHSRGQHPSPASYRCNRFRTASASNLEPNYTISHLIVTTKANQTLEAIKPYVRFLTPSSVIVLLQNGVLSSYASVRSVIPSTRIIFGSTTVGAYRTSPSSIFLSGPTGQTFLGPLLDSPSDTEVDRTLVALQDLSASLSDGPLAGASPNLNIEIKSASEINRIVILKLIANSIINPITSLGQFQNGVLSNDSPNASRLVELASHECARLFADRLGMSETALSAYLVDHVFDITTRTAANRSSMLEDTLAGRDTEIDCLNGYLVEVAQQRRISVPVLEFLFHMVKLKSNSTRLDRDS
ncbi:ketopantoate reductase PanE/ApbA C terminal-domain-containing protein [Polychytrium aggregatum]|uniref:ketopantoate reductase PanE/ApbA C terminal-domain-containing protein n=1 Tax=Polychytrium aggregatum TaxID=110093 RepID=UPI0022FDC9B3|nr:ketopantoate reductase PanE/ApbA C terminal-domain-containing protein [Polychytrium aggregatum]KAI9206843.1 ketopantoate reductase PanE/ApbA C terminal-domain-containing protein [Polychytrium aggregatum]